MGAPLMSKIPLKSVRPKRVSPGTVSMIYGIIKEDDEESPSSSPEDLWSTKIAPKLANSLEKADREKYRQEVTALLENLITQTGACVTIQKQAKMWLELKKS